MQGINAITRDRIRKARVRVEGVVEVDGEKFERQGSGELWWRGARPKATFHIGDATPVAFLDEKGVECPPHAVEVEGDEETGSGAAARSGEGASLEALADAERRYLQPIDELPLSLARRIDVERIRTAMRDETGAVRRRREELGLARDDAPAGSAAAAEREAALGWIGRAIARSDELIDDWTRNGRNTAIDQSVFAGPEAKRAALETARKETAAG